MKQSVLTLLDGVVDYAGLFPPATLDMRPAVVNYGRYLQSPHAWMLGRFVVPVSRLGEFVETVPDSEATWRLSVLAAGEVDGDRIDQFNHEYPGRFLIDSVELKASSPDGIASLVAAMPAGPDVFVEVPSDPDPREWLEAVSEACVLAKIRTGGVTSDLFPKAAAIARFILRCRDAGVSFKATAGLHHPLRADYRLTYDADSATGTMHGFLNVFLAAAMAQFGARQEMVVRVLESTSVQEFAFEDDWVQVLDHRFSEADLAETRSFIHSFGSCSFEEPVADLKGIGIL